MTTATALEPQTDEQIQKEVLAELKWDARVQPNEIGVAVKDGVVTLMGWVDSYTKHWAAEEAAHRVAGVAAVANDITVRTIGERTDADIAAAAVHALKWNSSVPADKIQVTVDHGWVTLRGQVDFAFQKRLAERAVERLSGVIGVTNLIQVKTQQPPSPEALKGQIEKALVRNAEIDARRITVEVQGSKVILRGTVSSYAEKKAAEETAWSAPGVTEVDNRLEVSPPA